MRIAASLVLLAGCDVLFQLQDVKPPVDAIDAAPPDAPLVPPALCSFPATWTLSTVGAGTFYTVDAAQTIAVFEDSGLIYETTPGSVSTAKRLFASISGLRSPRLAPSGTELFMHSDVPCCSVVVSTLQAGVWSPPTPIATTNHVISTNDLPGIPTAGDLVKRRMIISDTFDDAFYEMREDAAGWTQIYNYTNQTLGMTDIQDGDLSPDGYRMFFAGVRMAQTTQRVFAIDRTDLNQPFEASNVVEVRDSLQSASGLRTPYVSSDCKTLWFSVGTAVGAIVRKGVAP